MIVNIERAKWAHQDGSFKVVSFSLTSTIPGRGLPSEGDTPSGIFINGFIYVDNEKMSDAEHISGRIFSGLVSLFPIDNEEICVPLLKAAKEFIKENK